MTFAELPDYSWFVLASDPDHLPLFKSDSKSAVDLDYQRIEIAADAEVLTATLHAV